MGIYHDRLGRRRSPITLPGYRRGAVNVDKGRKRPAEVLTPDEIKRLLAVTSRRGIGGIRERALIVVLWRCGLRISEALDLKPRDLDLLGGFIRIEHGKGDKRGIVAIDPSAVEVLRKWLDVREGIENLPDDAPVFCTYSQPAPGGRLGAPQVRERLKLLGKRAGIAKRVHPHGFRHTMATELAREGVAMRTIQAQLRHENLLTTERYIAKLMPGEGLSSLHDRKPVEL